VLHALIVRLLRLWIKKVVYFSALNASRPKTVTRGKDQNGTIRRCHKISARGYRNTFSLTNRLADLLCTGFCWNRRDKIFCAMTWVHHCSYLREMCHYAVSQDNKKLGSIIKTIETHEAKTGHHKYNSKSQTLLQYSNQMHSYI
jgi:hypothetical protein